MSLNKKARLIAYYLPQYHPIPENDLWWGKGFTEWTNVAKAKPLFKGHYQPRIPADLGFYDLRLDESREAQADLAKEYGVYGFCYYHYWFGDGKQLLQRPLNEVLNTGRPDLPFCLCWANETWEGRWHGITSNPKKILVEQTYPGKDDIINHFNYLIKVFRDERYIRVNGKPIFQIYCPHLIPNLEKFIETLRELSLKNGLPGIYLIGGQKTPIGWNPESKGLDAVISSSFSVALSEARKRSDVLLDSMWSNKILFKLYTKGKSRNSITFYEYKDIINSMRRTHQKDLKGNFPVFPIIVNDWDNSPRAGKKSLIFRNVTPELYKEHIKDAIYCLQNKVSEERIIFVKSWNEWAEGNYLEPDTKFGMKYLDAIKDSLSS